METSSRILITGGTGFIGTYFVKEYLERGFQVSVLDLHPQEEAQELFENVRFVQGDVRDKSALRQAMEGCSKVLHLAAAHHDFGIKPETFEAVNVGAAEVICDVMDELGVIDICFFSSVAVYGTTNPPLTESSDANPESPYGATKLGGEKVFAEWCTKPDSNRCLVIRPTITFGPGNFANMFTLIKQIEKGAYLPVGDGSNIKSLSYVENIVSATLDMWNAKEPKGGIEIYNYVCKPDLSSGEIADTIYKALGKKKPWIRVPYTLARILALPFDLVIALTGKNLPISGARIKKLAKAQTQFESTKIRDAGYQQKVELREGIKRMVKWYLEEGKATATQGVKRRLPPEDIFKSNK